MRILPPREFAASVRDYIREHELMPIGSRVVAGVSGGPDSIAMLMVLHSLAPDFKWRIHVAHLDHGLRRGSRLDSAFVRRIASSLGLPFHAARIRVDLLAAKRKCSLEEAGRLARYHFFWGVARSTGARVVAVGHTLDDQVETVLMRLLRGSSGSGLSGIAPRRELKDPLGRTRERSLAWVVRPLLSRSRREIEGYLSARRVKSRNDRSNFRLVFMRNRIRHELLPMLERRYNPGVRRVLARAAQVLEEEDSYLESLAERFYRRSAGKGRAAVSLPLRALSARPLPLRRRILRIAAVRAGAFPNRLMQVHLDSLVRLAAGPGMDKAQSHLPGAVVVRTRGKLVFPRLRRK